MLLLGLLAASCASSASASDIEATQSVRLAYRDYRTRTHLVLVNDGYLVRHGIEGETFKQRRSEFYSRPRREVLPKVAEDEVMKGTVDYLFDQGFEQYAAAGEAPAETSAMGSSLEIRVDDSARFMSSYRGISEQELKSFVECVKVFTAVHSNIIQYQSVEGLLEFEQPIAPGRD